MLESLLESLESLLESLAWNPKSQGNLEMFTHH
jgi:hypothetical protein